MVIIVVIRGTLLTPPNKDIIAYFCHFVKNYF